MSDNLYQPPSAPISAGGYSGDAGISPLVIQHLVRTQPWVRLISLPGFIMTILVLSSAMFSFTRRQVYDSDAFQTGGVIGIIVTGILCLCPLILLNRYAGAIDKLKRTQSTTDLENALNQQRAYWKFVGVLVLIGVVIWLAGFVLGMLTPRATGLR